VKPALVISARDNVATALEPLGAGLALELGGHLVTARQAIPSGHKIALIPIAEGQPVIKYGSAIGTATMLIHAGDHVHTHNLASARGRGDLGHNRMDPKVGPRLAEPDEALNGAGKADGSGGGDA
jgi:altronate hydrolase